MKIFFVHLQKSFKSNVVMHFSQPTRFESLTFNLPNA